MNGPCDPRTHTHTTNESDSTEGRLERVQRGTGESRLTACRGHRHVGRSGGNVGVCVLHEAAVVTKDVKPPPNVLKKPQEVVLSHRAIQYAAPMDGIRRGVVQHPQASHHYHGEPIPLHALMVIGSIVCICLPPCPTLAFY